MRTGRMRIFVTSRPDEFQTANDMILLRIRPPTVYFYAPYSSSAPKTKLMRLRLLPACPKPTFPARKFAPVVPA